MLEFKRLFRIRNSFVYIYQESNHAVIPNSLANRIRSFFSRTRSIVLRLGRNLQTFWQHTNYLYNFQQQKINFDQFEFLSSRFGQNDDNTKSREGEREKNESNSFCLNSAMKSKRIAGRMQNGRQKIRRIPTSKRRTNGLAQEEERARERKNTWSENEAKNNYRTYSIRTLGEFVTVLSVMFKANVNGRFGSLLCVCVCANAQKTP